jgi:predicted dehydrogenase
MKNDNIQIALIGAGGMGSGDARMAVSIAGVKLLAVCDIYDGRLERARERWNKDLSTTRDYREILARRDIDAVIIATPDHWHKQITVEALSAGKHVYCEKPMVHSIDEGNAVVEAQQKSGKTFQVGSQYVSSLVYQKARDLLKAGAIGEINLVEAWLDRNTAIGAWQYSIPPDASPANIDWDRFLGSAPRRPFEPIRLFRWRNYVDYGTGVAGDLFVHLLSGLHTATGSLGPRRVYATGGQYFWKDGRDVPDLMLALLDYPKTGQHPAFTVSLKVNFESALPEESFGVKFVGSEGTMTTGYNELKLSRHPRETEPGYTIDTFPQVVQEEFKREYYARYPRKRPNADSIRPDKEETFVPPRGSDAHVLHHQNFYASVRAGGQSIEDAVFGFRAAGPALLTNVSYFERRACGWDPAAMQRV